MAGPGRATEAGQLNVMTMEVLRTDDTKEIQLKVCCKLMVTVFETFWGHRREICDHLNNSNAWILFGCINPLKQKFYLVTIEDLSLYLITNTVSLHWGSLAAGENNLSLIIMQSSNILRDNAGVFDINPLAPELFFFLILAHLYIKCE